jgi:hypothetical protein
VNHIGYSFVSQDPKGRYTMKNADMPAMPITDNEGSVVGASYAFVWGDKLACIGLTKREHFAGLALQGILCGDPSERFDTAAEYAVKHADALLAELNKEPTQ